MAVPFSVGLHDKTRLKYVTSKGRKRVNEYTNAFMRIKSMMELNKMWLYVELKLGICGILNIRNHFQQITVERKIKNQRFKKEPHNKLLHTQKSGGHNEVFLNSNRENGIFF